MNKTGRNKKGGITPTHSSQLGSSHLKPCSLCRPCSPAWCPPWQPEPSEGSWSPESDGTDAPTACALLPLRSACTVTNTVSHTRGYHSQWSRVLAAIDTFPNPVGSHQQTAVFHAYTSRQRRDISWKYMMTKYYKQTRSVPITTRDGISQIMIN